MGMKTTLQNYFLNIYLPNKLDFRPNFIDKRPEKIRRFL